VSKIAIKGADTGTGTFTIESPATNTDRTLTLPDEAGTVLTTSSDVLTSASTINSAKVKPSGLSYWPSFLVSGSNSGSWRSYTNGEILQFNDKTTNSLYDTGGNFNTSTYKFTAPVDGVYSISGSVYTLLNASEGGAAFYIDSVRVEGASSLHFMASDDAAQDQTASVTMTFVLTAGQTVSVHANSATDYFIQHSSFSGHLVAAI